jgi:hypothetical protein
VIDLLFWFLVSQTITGLPTMTPGTEVKVVAVDLYPVLATATVDNQSLIFDRALEANQEVRLLIIASGANESETVAALQNALFGRVSPDANDIYVQLPGLDGSLSFRKWLTDERGIRLVLP